VGLANARVPVDAYTIELSRGTGLKTYSLSVVEAVRRPGARLSRQSVEEIAEKMRLLLKDEGLRLRLKQAGLERAAFFSPKRFAERVSRAYEKVL
jgi:glycosyltransferase involved in cell wall biosynthesis